MLPPTWHTLPRSFLNKSTIIRFSARSFSLEASSAASLASSTGSPRRRGAVPCEETQAHIMVLCPQADAKLQAGYLNYVTKSTFIGRASRTDPRSIRRKRSGEEQHMDTPGECMSTSKQVRGRTPEKSAACSETYLCPPQNQARQHKVQG